MHDPVLAASKCKLNGRQTDEKKKKTREEKRMKWPVPGHAVCYYAPQKMSCGDLNVHW